MEMPYRLQVVLDGAGVAPSALRIAILPVCIVLLAAHDFLPELKIVGTPPGVNPRREDQAPRLTHPTGRPRLGATAVGQQYSRPLTQAGTGKR